LASCFIRRTWVRCPLGNRLAFGLLIVVDIGINS
jgi:hypothetical protein